MIEKANSSRILKFASALCIGFLTITSLDSGAAKAAETPPLAKTSPLSVFEGVRGHSRAVAPSRVPTGGTEAEHRVIPLLKPSTKPGGGGGKGRGGGGGGGGGGTDPALQTTSTTQVTPSGTGFDGIGVSRGYQVLGIPPDTNGAAGDGQYVQFVNIDYAVFKKDNGDFCYQNSSNTVCDGSGHFFRLSAIFKAAADFPQNNPCANRDDGDPVVLFDRMAHRWILSEFAVPAGGPYYHCVAVSQTNDATGSYNVYAFPQPYFPDYPKIGVWPDGYYATFNMFYGGAFFVGASVCVYERSQMLVGGPARQMCSPANTSYASFLPSDIDGKSGDLNPAYPANSSDCTGLACPLAGTPNMIATISGNTLQTGFVTVDWNANTGAIYWPQPVSGAKSFTPACNGGSCIPQPDTTQNLDSLADRLMFRLAYSRPCLSFSSGVCQSWDNNAHAVVSHAVTVYPGTSNVTGIRWYDLLPAFTKLNIEPWYSLTTTINQQSTFSPNSDYRWMSSVAMDRMGNIAVGYSRSNPNANPPLYPSVAVALGSITSSESTPLSEESFVRMGTGSQTSYSRWGDYSSMSVDPEDGCTLWFTSQFQTNTGVFDWSTYIYHTKVNSGCQ